MNDAPVVAGPATGATSDGSSPVTVSGLAAASDVDDGTVLSVVALPPLPPAKLENIFNPNGVVESAPVVAGTANGAATEGGAAATVDALATATDADDGAALTLVASPVPVAPIFDTLHDRAEIIALAAAAPIPAQPFDPSVLPAGVTYDAANHAFTLDPANTAYRYLSQGQTATVSIDYGVSDGFTVTAAKTVFTVTVTGTNSAPTVTGPVRLTVHEDGASAGFKASALVASATPVLAVRSAGDASAATISALNVVDMLANASDVDTRDVLSVAGLQTPLRAGIFMTQVPGGYYQPDIRIAQFFPNDPSFRHLAQGATETVVWNYGVSDGTATVGDTAIFTVTGVNDAPVILTQAGGVAFEDSAVQTVDVLANAMDYDDGAALSVVNVPALLPAGVSYNIATHSFSLNPADASFQALGQGETRSVVAGYGISDGMATTMGTIQWTVIGVNDAPVVTGPVLSTPNEGSGLVTINPLGNASDVDDHQGLHVVGLQPVLPAGLSFNAATDRFVFDSNNAAYDYLSLGEVLNLTVTYSATDGLIAVPTSTIISVQGKNDAPVVSGAVQGGTVSANAAPVTLSLLSNATDVDHLDILSIVSGNTGPATASVTSGVWASPVSFSIANNQLTLNPAQFASLALGKSVGLTFSYQVTDGNAGVTVADTATLTILGTNAGPSGVSVTPIASSLGKLIAGSGLNPKQALASLGQIGGLAADSFSYAIGGAGAGSFVLGSSSGVTQLQTGLSGPVGAAGGKLYALTLTATDTTGGISSAATPLNVVVGAGKNGDTVNLAALPGMVSSAPSFIYDLGGADTVNGAGMTGKLWIEGGQGADRMTGGSGANTYLYGATSDSTAAAMDIVTNFHAAVDMLDFTGLGTKFASIAALAASATTIAGGAIGWQVAGGNTFVYVNTSGNSQNLGSAAMKVELLGNAGLTAGNIAHL